MTELVAVAVDGSPAGQVATALAAKMALKLNARALVLCTIDQAFSLHPSGGEISIAEQTDFPAPAREQLTAETIVSEAVAVFEAAGVGAEGRVVIGTPSKMIVRSAEEAEASLIVIGHRHLSWFDRLLHPSICWEVLEHAHCPVLVSTAETA